VKNDYFFLPKTTLNIVFFWLRKIVRLYQPRLKANLKKHLHFIRWLPNMGIVFVNYWMQNLSQIFFHVRATPFINLRFQFTTVPFICSLTAENWVFFGLKMVCKLYCHHSSANKPPAVCSEIINVLGYDCRNFSNPSDIKVYDAEASCQSDPELPGEKKKVKIVQLVENKELWSPRTVNPSIVASSAKTNPSYRWNKRRQLWYP